MGRPKKSDVTLDVELPDPADLVSNVVNNETLATLEKLDTSVPEELIPATSDPEWHDYVMKQFTKDELIKDKPTTDGARRLVEKLVGEIVETNFDVLETVKYHNSTKLTPVTVRCRIKVARNGRESLSYEDVADVSDLNTPFEFARHATATAATRAEGRVLRKMLKLRKVVTAEEADAPPIEEIMANERIRDGQIRFIDVLCARIDVNVMKYINFGSKLYKNIKDVPYETAVEMQSYLSSLDTEANRKDIPQEIRGYDPKWKEKESLAF